MTLGGLKEGVTPLEMAFAYSTIANRGVKVSGSLAVLRGRARRDPEGRRRAARTTRTRRGATRVFPADVADTAQELLAGVVLGGTGKAAQIGEFAAGKTGTTENYGDAWFVGFNKELTVAVWVGYPDELQYMKTEYHGGEVAGGTFPTEIWHDFMRSWIAIRERREAESGKKDDEDERPRPTRPPSPSAPEGQSTGPGRARGRRRPGGPEGAAQAVARPRRRRPRPPPLPRPAPAPTPAPGARPAAAGRAAAPRPASGPHRRGQGRDTLAAGRVAEAPRQVHRHVDPDPRAHGDLGRRARCAAGSRSARRAAACR